MAGITENLLLIETKGFSMWPFLRGQEKLIVRKIPISDLRLGDLVLYKADNQLVCHRLVKKTQTNNGYLIYSRGDASFGSAELVNEQMFLGKVIGILKNDRITCLEGISQQVFNRINLIVLPLLNFIIKSCYKILFTPLPAKRDPALSGKNAKCPLKRRKNFCVFTDFSHP